MKQSTKCVGFNAFINNDKPEGFGGGFNEYNGFDIDTIDKIHNQIQEMVNDEYDKFINQDYAYFDSATKVEAINNIRDQLAELIPIVKETNDIKYLMAIIGNIWLLTRIGVIVDNEYNGMAFAYQTV